MHWDDPEGWYGEGGGRGVQDEEHMHTHGGFMSMYGKTNIQESVAFLYTSNNKLLLLSHFSRV